MRNFVPADGTFLGDDRAAFMTAGLSTTLRTSRNSAAGPYCEAAPQPRCVSCSAIYHWPSDPCVRLGTTIFSVAIENCGHHRVAHERCGSGVGPTGEPRPCPASCLPTRRRDWSRSADVILICNLVDDEIAAGGTDL